jgi:hypothetical protein
MFCPKCRAEYDPGIRECADCAVALVEKLPPAPPHDSIWDTGDTVKLVEPADLAALTLAKMRLDMAGIPYLVKNEALQNLFGYGAIGGYSHPVGPTQIRVMKTDAAAAFAALSDAEEPDAPAS